MAGPVEAHNATSPNVLKVVCAFPLSSNYGPGSRILYYVLVAACVTFRKAEWLRNACLAAALVLPAIASLQGLVLASYHVNGAVDLDIYGAFQVCSIGILAAPLTVRLSRTYFFDPGRNIIFVWTILILAGLVALCVEFYRVTPAQCPPGNEGITNATRARTFPYGEANCGLVCSEEDGPFSPMRGGAAANVNVIPVPTVLTFNAAMLLSAGFCIPGILSLIFTFDKILAINWKRRRESERLDERIEGTNITVGEIRGINHVVRLFLSVVEIPLFGGVILTLIGVGEANFFSPQMLFDLEPMASIGQWSPIAGTILAAIGSLYLLWTNESFTAPVQSTSNDQQMNRETPTGQPTFQDLSLTRSPEMMSIRTPSPHALGRIPTVNEPESEYDEDTPAARQQRADEVAFGRNKVRQWFSSAAEKMGNAAHDKFDVSDFRDERAHGFPEIPGEGFRNPALERISTQYSRMREESSRAGSTYAPSINSGFDDRDSPPPAPDSPRPEGSPPRKPKRRDTLDVPKRPNLEFIPRSPTRRDTLEVPASTAHPLLAEASSSRQPRRRATLEIPTSAPRSPEISSPKRRSTLEVPRPSSETPRTETPARRTTLEVPSPTYSSHRSNPSQ